MRPRLQELLVCPIDRGPLELLAWETDATPLSPSQRENAQSLGIDPRALEEDVRSGVLRNPRLKIFYPVFRGVPRLLTFPVAVHRTFMEKYGERVASECRDYHLPEKEPRPGEPDVLRTFSSEWLNYGWNEKAYWNVPAEQMYKAMRFMLDLDHHPVRGKKVLETGIGIGGIANHVVTTDGCELVGTDLSYTVDPAYHYFARSNPFLHVVQASLFAPPFLDEAFDLVYSHGVLHHTHSTREALASIARLTKKGGRLYVWVYSWYDERRTFIRRSLLRLENVLRPLLWRLPETAQAVALIPLVPLYLLHQNVLNRGEGASYGWREAIHAARDRFTPRFVHRHDEEEVLQWFRALGYIQLRTVSQRSKPDYVPTSLVTCVGVDGIRA